MAKSGVAVDTARKPAAAKARASKGMPQGSADRVQHNGPEDAAQLTLVQDIDAILVRLGERIATQNTNMDALLERLSRKAG